jgi:hypothetical protein
MLGIGEFGIASKKKITVIFFQCHKAESSIARDGDLLKLNLTKVSTI